MIDRNFLENIEQIVYYLESLGVHYKIVRLLSVTPEEAGIPREAGQDTVMRQPPQYHDSSIVGQLQGAPCTTV